MSKKVSFSSKGKSLAFSKSLKISKAQEYMLLAVLITSMLLGATLALGIHMVKQIDFNKQVISEKDKSVQNYSDTIKNVGVCEAPNGKTYSDSELDKCSPESVQISNIPGSLRYNILNNLAANESLNSVPKDTDAGCVNPSTKKNYTYEELMEKYNNAADDQKSAATDLLETCSALRVIPDALPSYRNEEALLASLNKIFLESGFSPESLSPSDSGSTAGLSSNLNGIQVRLNVEQSVALTQRFLVNLERSIREYRIERATFDWGSSANGADKLSMSATATAYYVGEAGLNERTETIDPENGITKSGS